MMTPKQQAALERDGWKIGTVQELLGLSDAEANEIEQRVLLHQLYTSLGRMNDAITAGDKSGFEKEVNKQVELRGRFLQCS